jgi:co-chaperonin GroES (HSP10)
LQPSDASKSPVPLVTSPIDVELTQLETEKALLNAASAPDGTYSGINLTFANPQFTILNQTGQPITMGTQTCLNGHVCEFKPALNQSSLTISSTPFPVTISTTAPMSLVLDFDLNASIQNNLSVTPTVTLAAVPAKPSDSEIENIEGLKGQVQNVSTAGFTLKDSTSGQTFTLNVDNTTQFQGFNEVGCAANNFSCVQAGQIVEVEHLLVKTDGTLLASQIQLDDAANQEQLEGTIVAVNAASNQFQMVVENEEPAAQGVSVGNSVTISINAGAQYAVDSDDLSGAIPSGVSFASASDLLVGQEVKVRALIVSSSTTGTTATTDRVKLHMSQFPGTVASLNAPNFAVNNLPALFTSNGINQVQVVVSSGTESEGISGGSSLIVGNNVVLRGLLFKTAGDPILIAKKVRKR